MIRLGLVGLGTIARFYVAAIPGTPGLELAAVCDRSAEKLADASVRGALKFESYRDLLASPAVDAVVICLPNAWHFEVSQQALSANKHVCCEKPLALTAAEGSRLTTLARERGLGLFTAFHRSYNPVVLATRSRLQDCRVVHVDAHYLEWIEDHVGASNWYIDPKLNGGGALIDNGPNVFDVLAQFLGNLAVDRCRLHNVRRGVEYGAEVWVHGEHGGTAKIELDWMYPGERKTLALQLEDGRQVVVDMLEGATAHKSTLYPEYAALVRDFREAVLERRVCDRGLAAARLVETGYALARQPPAR